jgi:hypothetical protein
MNEAEVGLVDFGQFYLGIARRSYEALLKLKGPTEDRAHHQERRPGARILPLPARRHVHRLFRLRS